MVNNIRKKYTVKYEWGYIQFSIIAKNMVMDDVFIDHKYRGRGLSTKMLLDFKKKYIDNNTYGVDHVFAAVVNSKLHAIYKKMEFIPTDKPIPYWGQPSNGTNYYLKIKQK